MEYDYTLVRICNETIGSVKYLNKDMIRGAVGYIKRHDQCKDIPSKMVYKHLRYTMRLLKRLDRGAL